MFSNKVFKLLLLLLVLFVCVQQSQAGKFSRIKKSFTRGFKKFIAPIRKVFDVFALPFNKLSNKSKNKPPIHKEKKNKPQDPNAPQNEPFENKILRLHQEIRKKVNLDSKAEFTWDRTLAVEAQNWAKLCDNSYMSYNDSRKSLYGQNLYVVKHGMADVYTAVKSWESTKEDYDPVKQECIKGKNCYPYLQMVWPETKYVGCWLQRCDNVAKLGVWGSVLACLYTPI